MRQGVTPHSQQAFQETPSNPPADNHNHSQDSTSPGTSLPGRTDTDPSHPATTITSLTNARRESRHLTSNLTVASANVPGLFTNVGDLTHNLVLRHQADIVTVTETWLNREVEPTFGKILSYSH